MVMGNTRWLGMPSSSRTTTSWSWCSHCGMRLATPPGSGSSVLCAFCHRVTRIERHKNRGVGDGAAATTMALAVTSPPCAPLLSVKRGFPAGYPRICGKKRALLVGVSYTGTPHELKGTANDVAEMRRILVDKFGFPSGCILELTGKQRIQEPRAVVPFLAELCEK